MPRVGIAPPGHADGAFPDEVGGGESLTSIGASNTIEINGFYRGNPLLWREGKPLASRTVRGTLEKVI